jgi:hypothetical protein
MLADRMLFPARRLTALAGVLGILVALVVTGASTARAEDAAPPGGAWIRAGHLVPGFGSARLDLVPKSGPATSVVMSPSASYGDVTEYQKIDPGDYTVTVRPQGATLESAPLLQRAFTVVAGKATTLVAVGTADNPRLVALDDDLTLPAASSARVRILPAASNTQTVSIAAQNGPTLTSGAILGQATDYTSVPAGSWTLDLASGGGPTAQQTVDLKSGSVYTAIVLDSAPGAVTIKVITDAAGAMTAPQGAAQTGGGGMAAQLAASDESHSQTRTGSVLVLALAAALALTLGASRGRAEGQRPRRRLGGADRR